MSDDPYFEHTRLLDPPIQRAAYSDRTAWIMAKLSQVAYEQFEGTDKESAEAATARLHKKLRSGGFELVETFIKSTRRMGAEPKRGNDITMPKVDTQAILVRKPGSMAVLAFRGSEPNVTDWVYTDADAVFVETGEGEGRIHRGFYEAFQVVREDIERAIADPEKVPPGLPVYVTGHSLGGALANVAGMELEKVRTLAAVYTYGSPRVGDDLWASRMKVPVYRVVNGRDIVPLMPFSSLIGNFLRRLGLGRVVRMVRKGIIGYIGYRHVGDFRHLTQDGRLVTGTAATFSRLGDIFVDGVVAVFRRSFKVIGVAMKYGTDHFMPNYIAKLEKVALDRNAETKDT